MALERYLLPDRYLEPLGFVLIGLTILAVEVYNYTQVGVTSAGGIMAAIGVLSLLVGGRRWQERAAREDGGNVSLLKHLFLVAVLAVIVASQFL
ncbi:hypothetical protein BRC66_04475 [Halobacteriales archaeon QH_2_66_30]|nr:MAG: hypothetical protein BRC66_04475 [Halobacteriales archaeon QH_2_66_30]